MPVMPHTFLITHLQTAPFAAAQAQAAGGLFGQAANPPTTLFGTQTPAAPAPFGQPAGAAAAPTIPAAPAMVCVLCSVSACMPNEWNDIKHTHFCNAMADQGMRADFLFVASGLQSMFKGTWGFGCHVIIGS